MSKYVGSNYAAFILEVSPNTLKKWVKLGFIRPARVLPDGRYQFILEDLDNFKEKMETDLVEAAVKKQKD